MTQNTLVLGGGATGLELVTVGAASGRTTTIVDRSVDADGSAAPTGVAESVEFEG